MAHPVLAGTSGTRSERFLKPVMRILLAIERRDLAIAGAPVELLSLGQRLIRFESRSVVPNVAGSLLQLLEEALP